jgi:hypothetical protein
LISTYFTKQLSCKIESSLVLYSSEATPFKRETARHGGACLQIPTILEAEVGGWQFKASPGQSMKSYLKNKLKQKGLEA